MSKAALQAGRAVLPCKRARRVSKATMQAGRARLSLRKIHPRPGRGAMGGEQGCPASGASKATLQESEQGEQGYHAGGASKAALEGRCCGGNACSQCMQI